MTAGESALGDYVTQQRWYGAKSQAVTGAAVLDTVPIRSEPPLELALVELRFETGAHDLYQLVFAGEDGARVDALAGDPSLARELVAAIRAGASVQGSQGTAEFRPAGDLPPTAGEPGSARLISAEQSNSSVVLDGALILKVYRRLEPGINPELELNRFLTEHGFRDIPALGGWYSYAGGPLAATLGMLQEFVADGRDGWELALDELAADPERLLGRLERLGEVTGRLHGVLGSDPDDPAFAPEEPSVEALSLLTATVDEEIVRVFGSLPEDDDRLAPIVGRGGELRERLHLLTHPGPAGRTIRTHGDYHLGQALARGRDGWVLLDFEGEPGRTLLERRRKRSPLRDVAGMLRSFAYAATAAELTRGAEVPAGWEQEARERFLGGYLGAVDATLLPPGEAAVARLLAVFELEKAVYELRYELDHRPDWVRIPVAGIGRLLEQAAEAP